MAENLEKQATRIRELGSEVHTLKKQLTKSEAQNVELTEDRDAKQVRIEELEEALAASRAAHEELDARFQSLLLHNDQRSVKLCDLEQRFLQLIEYISVFDKEKTQLEDTIQEKSAEVDRLSALLNKPKSTSGCQATEEMCTNDVQTDLSYQYLEGAAELHDGPKRKERLSAMKHASDFYEDEVDRRDFTVSMRSLVGNELRLEPPIANRTLVKGEPNKPVVMRAPRTLPQVQASPIKTPRGVQPAAPTGAPGAPQRGCWSARRGHGQSLTPSPWTDDLAHLS